MPGLGNVEVFPSMIDRLYFIDHIVFPIADGGITIVIMEKMRVLYVNLWVSSVELYICFLLVAYTQKLSEFSIVEI